MSNVRPLVQRRSFKRSLGAALSIAIAGPAEAGAMDPRGNAQAQMIFFGALALLLYFTVVCLISLVDRRPWRRSGVRLALWAFPAAAVAPAAYLGVLFATHAYSKIDTALTWGLVFLVIAGITLVTYAFTSSRRAGA